jgi:hypothetical protein
MGSITIFIRFLFSMFVFCLAPCQSVNKRIIKDNVPPFLFINVFFIWPKCNHSMNDQVGFHFDHFSCYSTIGVVEASKKMGSLISPKKTICS